MSNISIVLVIPFIAFLVVKFLKDIFTDPCKLGKHHNNVEFVYHSSKKNYLSACPVTAKVYKCKRCGFEERVLTDAGYQQLYWGDNINELLGLE